jgi:hypothetical protein
MNPELRLMDDDPLETRGSDEAAGELTAETVRNRLELLRKQGLKQALPMLMLELDRVHRSRMDPYDRVAAMENLKKPVLKAAAGLPKPMTSASAAEQGVPLGLTLEQRLFMLMTRNLRQCLMELDRARSSVLIEEDDEREWVLRQFFRFIGRQIRYGIDWDRPWPKHTWQDLHDLFLYLVGRGSVALQSGFSVAAFDDEFDAQVEYKRLLLLGLADRLTERRSRTGDFFHMLKRWASETVLRDPERVIGESNVIKVEVKRDEPPRLREGKLTESFRGWIICPADGFDAYVQHVNRGGAKVLRMNSYR